MVMVMLVSLLAGCGDDDDDDDDDDDYRKPTEQTTPEPGGNSTTQDPPGGNSTTQDPPGNPSEALLKVGEYVYLALPDLNVNRIGVSAPKQLAITQIKGASNNMIATMDSKQIDEVVKAFAKLKVTSYDGVSSSSKQSSVTFVWSDGSQSTVLFEGSKLAYNTGKEVQLYSLEGGDEFWTTAMGSGGSGGDTEDLKTVTCTEEKFETQVPEECPTLYKSGDGFYIGANGADVDANIIPYVLVARWSGLGVSAQDYLSEVATPAFRNTYGDNLLQISEQEKLDVQFADGVTRTMYGMAFRYNASGNSLWMYRVVGEFGSDLVTFTAKYIDGEAWSENQAMGLLEYAVVYFRLTDAKQVDNKPTPTPKPGGNNNSGDFRVVASDSASVKYTKYDNGLFSADVPEGWVVNVHELADYLHYTFQIYDPKNPDRRVYYNIRLEGLFASEADYKFFKNAYPTSVLAQMPWVDPHNTEEFFKKFNEVMEPNYTANFRCQTMKNFRKIEQIGTDMFGGDIIRGTFKNGSGEDIGGVFSVSYLVASLYYVNVMYTYNTYSLTAPESELTSWMPVLEHIFGSIQFSNEFVKGVNQELTTVSQGIRNVAKICSETTDIVISGWESRQASYDRISQKQSDATLGYERVYDTEKDMIYRAPLDFFDNYSGDRYQAVTDNQYLLPVDGYIEWK